MFIEWKGHSCFLLTAQNGVRLLTDPFNERVGYPLPKVEVDGVTVSHEHYDHNSAELLPGKPVVVKGPGQHLVSGIEIRGIASFHDEEQGNARGLNTVFMMTIDGIRICHLGDLGHLLSPAQLAEIGDVDVLCIPVGGFYTIDAGTAREIVAQLKPSVVLPMHYKYDDHVKLPIAPVADFLQYYPTTENRDILELTAKDLASPLKIITLTLKRG